MAVQQLMPLLRAHHPGDSLAGFVTEAWGAFEEARRLSGAGQDREFEVGSSRLRISFAGSGMPGNVIPALAHLAVPPGPDVDLEIAVWDSAATGIPLPATPWPAEAMVARGEIQGLSGHAGVEVAYQPGSGQLSLLERRSARAMLWMPDAGQCPYWEKAAPLRTVLHWWFLGRDCQLVHGAAVGDDEGALLLTGKGGSGKSTTSLAALLNGMSFLGDDYVLCDLSLSPPRVSSLYGTAKVDADAVRRLPPLAGKLERETADQEKGVLRVERHFPGRIPASLTLRAVVVPQVSGASRHAIQPMRASAALLALAPTTVFQLPGARDATLRILAQLVGAVPCFRLDLGPDASGAPAVLRRLLAECR